MNRIGTDIELTIPSHTAGANERSRENRSLNPSTPRSFHPVLFLGPHVPISTRTKKLPFLFQAAIDSVDHP